MGGLEAIAVDVAAALRWERETCPSGGYEVVGIAWVAGTRARPRETRLTRPLAGADAKPEVSQSIKRTRGAHDDVGTYTAAPPAYMVLRAVTKVNELPHHTQQQARSRRGQLLSWRFLAGPATLQAIHGACK